MWWKYASIILDIESRRGGLHDTILYPVKETQDRANVVFSNMLFFLCVACITDLHLQFKNMKFGERVSLNDFVLVCVSLRALQLSGILLGVFPCFASCPAPGFLFVGRHMD